jgi:hypothetical protein
MVPPDPLPPSPSISTPMKTPDPQPPNISASLTETEQTPEKTQRGAHDGTEPAVIGDIVMEYSSDLLCSPSKGIVTKNYLKELRSV